MLRRRPELIFGRIDRNARAADESSCAPKNTALEIKIFRSAAHRTSFFERSPNGFNKRRVATEVINGTGGSELGRIGFPLAQSGFVNPEKRWLD